MENNEKKVVMVERETYERNGKTYYSYFIKGKLRGVDFKAGVQPHDIGGYTVLDIVFDGKMEAELVTKPWEIKDEKTGAVNSGMTYAVVSYDEDGTVYECAIKPARRSDKDLMNMLFKA